MANGGIRIATRRLNPDWMKLIRQNLRNLSRKEAVAGFPRGGKAASVTYDNGASVLDVAVWNQFGADIDHPGGTAYAREMTSNGLSSMGSPAYRVRFVKNSDPRAADLPRTRPHKISIPARPFMDQAHERIVKDGRGEMVAVAKAANRREINATRALQKVALFGEKCIQEAIIDGSYVPNAPATVRQKDSTKPLIDDGTMLGSVQSVVRDRED